MQRFIIGMGTGNDLDGGDYTKAAERAVEDATRQSLLALIPALGLSRDQMKVKVTIGVQNPGAVDIDRVTQTLAHGQVTVTAVEGGLDITNPDNGSVTVIASAAVEAFLDAEDVKAAVEAL